MNLKNILFIYFISLIIIPIIALLIMGKILYAGIFIGAGCLMLFFTYTEKGKKIADKIF